MAKKRAFADILNEVDKKIITPNTAQKKRNVTTQYNTANNSMSEPERSNNDLSNRQVTSKKPFKDIMNEYEVERKTLSSSTTAINKKHTSSQDYEKYSTMGSSIKNPSYKDANKGISIAGWKPFSEPVKNKVSYSRENAATIAMSNGSAKGDPKYKFMTEEEVGVYNYLLAKNGEDEADKYLKDIDRILNARSTRGYIEASSKLADDNKVAGTALNLGMSMFTPTAYAATLGQTIKNKVTGSNDVVDTNSGAFGAVNIEAGTREGLKKDTGEVGDFLIDTGLSMGQFLTKLPFGKIGSLAIMGTGAAGQTAKDIANRGGSQDQIVKGSTMAGAAEIIFEKISLDQLKAFKLNPATNVGQLFKNILKSSVTEGSEEVATDLANEIVDRFNMSDLSNYELNVQNYIRQGMSESEAKRKATVDFAGQLGLSFAGGALSGGVLGGGANFVGAYQNNQLGKTFAETNTTQDVINEGLASDPNTDAYKAAIELQNKINSGKKVGNMALGQQYINNVQAINQESLNADTNINNNDNNIAQPIVQNDNLQNYMKPQEQLHNNQYIQSETNPLMKLANEMVGLKQSEPINNSEQATQQGSNLTVQPVLNVSQRTAPTMQNIQPISDNNLSEPITKATAIFTNSDVPITVKGINNISNEGNIIVTIDNGESTSLANINDITFNNTETELIYGMSSNYKTNGAKAFISGYTGSLDVNTYSKGFNQYYNGGRTNLPIETIDNISAYSGLLPGNARIQAYYAGQNDASNEIATKQQKANEAKVSTKKDNGGIKQNEALNQISEEEKAVIHYISKATGVSVVVDDDIEGANGYYANGEIHISAKSENKPLVVFSHELTHHMEDTSPELWKEYRDYVINYMQEQHTEEYKSLTEHIKNLYRANELEVTDESIMNEIAANATEEFLTDADAIEKLIKDNRSLAEKIFDTLKRFLEVIKNKFSNYSATSTEGKMLRDNLNVLENARKLWMKALEDSTNSINTVTDKSKMFSLKDGKASFTKERMENILDKYGAKSTQRYSKAYVAFISPNDYLSLTTTNLSRIENESTKLDVNKLRSEYQDIFLNFDQKTGEITGHEGRHRMVALRNEEINQVPIVLIPDGEKGRYDRTKIINMSFTGQEFYLNGEYVTAKGTVSLSNIIPASYEYKDELINTFVNDHSTIKFSLKDTSDVDIEQLSESSEKVNEATSLLKQQLNITKGYVPDVKDIDKMARNILKEYNSSYDKGTLVENLSNLFGYISNTETKMYEDAVEATTGMAKRIIEKSSVLDSRLDTQYADLKKYLRTTKIRLSNNAQREMASRYDTYNNFRRKYFGKIRLSEDGAELDSLWPELSHKYPELFPLDANETEQPQLLADALEITNPYMENEFGMVTDEQAQNLALKIFNEYFKAPALTINNVAALRKKYADKIKEIELSYKKEYAEKLINITDKSNTRLAQQKAKYEKRIKTNKFSRQERADIKLYKDRIEKNAYDVTTWLTNPTDTHHVPEILKRTVTDFLSSLDLRSNRLNIYGDLTKKTLRWNDAMDKLRLILTDIDESKVKEGETGGTYNDLYMDIDPELVQRLDLFARLNLQYENINNMNSEQLKELDYFVKQVKQSVMDANKLKANQLHKSVVDAGNASMEELSKMRNRKVHSSLITTLDNFININQLDSLSYAESLGNTAVSMQQALRKGQDKHTLNLKQVMDYMEELKDGIKTSGWTGKNATVKTFTIKGKEVKMTIAQIMELYELNKREQARGHIYGGGIKIEDITGKDEQSKKIVRLRHARPITLTDIDVDMIINSLTAEQKKIADGMQQFMSNQSSEWGNETSMQMYGYKKFTENNYYPIKSDDNYTTTNDQNSTTGQLYTLKNLGMTKGTMKNANNPLIIGDIFDTFTRHINEMSSYNALVVPLSDAMKWYNYKAKMNKEYVGSIKEGIERVWGRAGKSYFTNLIKDINGVSQASYGTELFSNMIANMKVASVGANLRVVLQQPTAYMRASYMIDTKYLIMGLAKKPQIEKANQYAPIALWKSWGFFDTNTGRSMKSIITGERSVIENIREKSLSLAGMMDNVTWGSLWNACEYETKAKHSELEYGSEEFNKAVGDRLSEVVDKTQVVDTVFHRSQMMRSKDLLVKTATSFMSEPNKNYNLLRNAITNAMSEKSASSYKNAYRAIVAVITSSVAAAAAAALMDAVREDDKDKKWEDRLKDAVKSNIADNLNPLNLLPYTREITSLLNGYKPSRMDMTALTNVYYAVNELIKWSQGESKKSNYAVFSQTSRAVSQVFGIPVGNLLREIEGIYNLISKEGIEMKSDVSSRNRIYSEMYEAMSDGDKAKYGSLEEYLFKNKSETATDEDVESSIDSGLSKALIENEPLIKQAGEAKMKGDFDKYLNIVKQLESTIGQDDSKKIVVRAVDNYINSLKPKVKHEEKETLYYNYDDLGTAVKNGDTEYIKIITVELLNSGTELKTIRAQVTKKCKDKYIEYVQNDNDVEAEKMEDILVSHFDYDVEDIKAWVPGISTSDMADAIVSGDYDKVVEIRDSKLEGITDDKEFRKKLSSLKSQVTPVARKAYINYWLYDDAAAMDQLKADLVGYFGYEEKTIDKWLKADEETMRKWLEDEEE